MANVLEKINQHLHILYYSIGEKAIPWYTKVLFAIIVGIYILSPIDIIPDMIPGFGVIDDALMIPLAVYIAVRLIPTDIKKRLQEKFEKDEK